MEEIISFLESMASAFMFFCMIFIFSKLIKDNKPIYIMGEIIFASLIVLSEVAVIYVKNYIGEPVIGNLFPVTICLIYALINVNNYIRLIEKKKNAKHKKGEKFDRRV